MCGYESISFVANFTRAKTSVFINLESSQLNYNLSGNVFQLDSTAKT